MDDLTFFMGRWALPTLLKYVSVDHLLLILGCCLTEMRVVFVADDLQILSACVFSLLLLLRPLSWAGPVIVTLPHTLSAYLESPVPLILGVNALPDVFTLEPGMVVVHPLCNKVRVPSLWGIAMCLSRNEVRLCGRWSCTQSMSGTPTL